jgi:hypothetical protein
MQLGLPVNKPHLMPLYFDGLDANMRSNCRALINCLQLKSKRNPELGLQCQASFPISEFRDCEKVGFGIQNELSVMLSLYSTTLHVEPRTKFPVN